MKMGKYIEYLRKSQMDRDYENLSVEETLNRHRAILADFVKSQKLNVVVTLEEVVSAESLSARPQMMKLLELVNTGEYDGIVCMDLDRLSRGSSFDSGYIMQILQLNNCKIITPQKTYDFQNESDEQFADLKFMFARYELQTITKRMKNGRNTSVAEGKFVASRAPLGYRSVKIKGEKGSVLEIVPEEAKIVQMIFDWYTEEGVGSGTIAYRLDELHIRPTFTTSWSPQHVIQIIKNETYIGKLPWQRKPVQKKFVDGKLVKKTLLNKNYELHEGRHDPIISEEQFELAQRIRTNRYVTPSKSEFEIANPLAGLLFCEHCGWRMERVTPAKSNPNAKPRYRCAKSKRCGCKSTQVFRVEEAVVKAMKEWLGGYILELDYKELPEDDGLELSLKMQQERLEDLYEQQDKICDLFEKGKYSERLFNKRNDALEKEITKVQFDIEDLEEKISNRREQHAVERNIIPTTQRLLDNYDDLTAKEKNALWKEVLEKITYSKTEKGGEFNITIYPKLTYKPQQTQ